MLVVLAIIAILAALLFPVLTRAKIRGKDMNCINNLSQIGKSLSLYAIDHDQYLPWAPSEIAVYQYQGQSQIEDNYFTLPTIKHTLFPYGAVEQLFRCPRDTFYSGPDPVTGNWVVDESSSFYERAGSSYLISGSGPKRLLSMAIVNDSDPSKHVLAIDAEGFHGDVGTPEAMVNATYYDLHIDTVPLRQD